ncbi:MAG: helix-turn-helix domain-containing protein [Clostridia bacterium]|nr:helix-turn-helix domain-containing protein [Clostridia bacterium]
MDVIKNDRGANIGANIRRIRLESNIGQTDLVRIMQLMGADITREALVKIEKGKQHVKVSQLKAIKTALGTTYEDLLE